MRATNNSDNSASPNVDYLRVLTMAALAPPPKTSILIYAELLTNIRQITVKTCLPTPADNTTAAEIFGDGRKFRISHNGATAELDLPATVPVKGALPVSHKGSADLTWRLPLQPARAPERQFLPENQVLPWSAFDIKMESPVSCRACGQLFVQRGTITSWKDLPSENWAEMMEFWHCHKPVEHDKPEDGSLQQRGYGAASAITAQPGVGFVDITSFLFVESDCGSLKVSQQASSFVWHANGEIEGGQVRATAFQCHGHRYNSPIWSNPAHAEFYAASLLDVPSSLGWVFYETKLYSAIPLCTQVFQRCEFSGPLREIHFNTSEKKKGSQLVTNLHDSILLPHMEASIAASRLSRPLAKKNSSTLAAVIVLLTLERLAFWHRRFPCSNGRCPAKCHRY